MKKVLSLIFILTALNARAVILFDAADPPENRVAPTGTLTGSGWQYEGMFGGFLGTPIASHFFLTAKHIDQAGANFVFNSVTYTLVNHFNDPYSDFAIWQVAEIFPTLAPLYISQDEKTRHLVVIGRGTDRGGEIFLNATRRGWAWGDSNAVQRWGENDVADVVSVGPQPKNDALFASFDQSAQPHESHLSGGDSGGAVFLNDNGVWKLAGINYAVDDLYTQPADSSQFMAAIYDARGYYAKTGINNFVLISGNDPVPTGFYATRVSSKLDWIYSVTDPTGDANGNGNSNLLDYASTLNSPLPQGYGATTVSIENGFAVLTYRKITNAPTLTYQIERLTGFDSWNAVTTQDEIVVTQENVQTIKAKFTIGSATSMLLRLRISESVLTASRASGATFARAAYKTHSGR